VTASRFLPRAVCISVLESQRLYAAAEMPAGTIERRQQDATIVEPSA
jgi:hypothetical protein